MLAAAELLVKFDAELASSHHSFSQFVAAGRGPAVPSNQREPNRKLAWSWVKTHGIPFLDREFTTHFRTYFSGDWDVHWGYGILTHSRVGSRQLRHLMLSREVKWRERIGAFKAGSVNPLKCEG